MSQDERRAFVFTGSGPAYFRIWIVNLLLSAVTLGFYSPWAKVRRIRYFYGNTLIDGSPLEFHGRPIALLKGRLIGLVLLVAYTQTERFSLKLWIGVVCVLLWLLPWLLWKSLRFRLANSSYRGIRFGFDGTLADAYRTFVPLMLMVVGPALILFASQPSGQETRDAAFPIAYVIAVAVVIALAPWSYFRLRAYQHRHARLGATPFGFDGRVKSAYGIAFKVFLLGIGFVCVAGAAAAVFGGGIYFLMLRAHWRSAETIGVALGFAAGYLVMLSAVSQPTALIQNFVWQHTTLGGARFDSRVDRSRAWTILFGNLVLTVLTLGFYWPFGVIRTMRYRIGRIAYDGDSDTIVAGAADARLGATGEETADLFGLELAL